MQTGPVHSLQWLVTVWIGHDHPPLHHVATWCAPAMHDQRLNGSRTSPSYMWSNGSHCFDHAYFKTLLLFILPFCFTIQERKVSERKKERAQEWEREESWASFSSTATSLSPSSSFLPWKININLSSVHFSLMPMHLTTTISSSFQDQMQTSFEFFGNNPLPTVATIFFFVPESFIPLIFGIQTTVYFW